MNMKLVAKRQIVSIHIGLYFRWCAPAALLASVVFRACSEASLSLCMYAQRVLGSLVSGMRGM